MKIYRIFVTVLVNLSFLAVFLGAQETNIRFKHITLEEGLSQSSVYCIAQDDMGFMWFGTESGLNKYDGYQMKVFISDTEDPLSISNSYILCMCFDDEKILWLGTERGVNIYSHATESFTQFQHDPNDPYSISNNRILSLGKDRHGNIWVGTENGLNRFDREQSHFIRYMPNPQNPNGLKHPSIKAIYNDRSGTLWVGTNGGGLHRYNEESNNFTSYTHQPDNGQSIGDDTVLAIYEDRKNNLWIGTEKGGLGLFNRKTGTFTHYKNDPNNPFSLSENHVNVVLEDELGRLWIGTNDGGANYFDRKNRRFIRYQANADDPDSLLGNRILSLFEDQTGGLWFGNYSGGVNYYNRDTQKFILYQTDPTDPYSLSYNDTRPIYEDKNGIIWIGTDSGGLNRFDRKTGKFTHFKHDPENRYSISDNRVFTIGEDQNGNMWVGTNGGGLNRFDKNSGRFYRHQHDPDDPSSISSNNIRAMAIDQNNAVWIGTDGGGLNRADRRNNRFIHYRFNRDDPNSLSNNRIFSLRVDSKGILWIGTFGGGLNKLEPEKETFTRYRFDPNHPNSISDDFVLSIREDHNGNIWVGTMGGGISKLNRETDEFVTYTDKDGLPDNNIYDILEDNQGYLWLSSNKGLAKFHPETKEIKIYDVKDGLQSNEFNTGTGYKCRNGEMFFGGINGVNRFRPEEVRDNPHIPPVVITGFLLSNKPVPIGENEKGRTILMQSISKTSDIRLSYRDKSFSFEFAALHYASPDKNMYKYQMKGFDDDWNDVGNRRFASYTGLPPGDYTFMVKGSNNDGIWNENPSTINIYIKPPFWKTLWFLSLCAVMLLLSAFGLFRLRVRQLIKREEELEDLVNERTSQLADANTELEKLSIVARETDNAVQIMDEKGNFEWVNEGFIRMYEYNLDEMIQKFGRNIQDSSSNPNIKEVIHKCLTEKIPVIYESMDITKSGRQVWAQTTLTPILDDQGNIKKLIAIDTDITKVKAAELKADQANQSKSEFLARMSHEIRTPMNGVIGFADMLLDTQLTGEQSDYVRTITRSGEALITILNDILDFSKIEAGELTFDPIDFDPEVTVFDICEIISPRLGTKRVELICRVGDNVPAHIRSDAGRFRQVIVNLMGNAAKFTEEGEIELSLEVEEEKSDRLKLHVKVRDTGIGIPEEKLATVFDVFQQVDGSTTRKYGGTGLGLTICKQIARLMEGDVWVESTVDKGSTFHFTCWVDRSTKTIDKQLPMEHLEGKRALIVDDNATNLEILSHILGKFQMEAIPEKDPTKVVSVLQNCDRKGITIDICIIDIQMPKYSGYDLAEQIRNLPAPLSGVPLLAFSSSTLSRSRKYRESGFDAYLPKPVRRKKMLMMLERLLGEEKKDDTPSKKDQILTQHTIVEDSKHSIHILLAEDNPINYKLAKLMLERGGYQVSLAKNGEEAVKIYTAHPHQFDLILMDIQMPVMNGREATGEIRKQGFTDVPIIAMTAESMKGDREKCIDAGMNDYISKPIKRDVVFKMVKKWCLEEGE